MEQFIKGMTRDMLKVMWDGYIENWMRKLKNESDNKEIIAGKLHT